MTIREIERAEADLRELAWTADRPREPAWRQTLRFSLLIGGATSAAVLLSATILKVSRDEAWWPDWQNLAAALAIGVLLVPFCWCFVALTVERWLARTREDRLERLSGPLNRGIFVLGSSLTTILVILTLPDTAAAAMLFGVLWLGVGLVPAGLLLMARKWSRGPAVFAVVQFADRLDGRRRRMQAELSSQS